MWVQGVRTAGNGVRTNVGLICNCFSEASGVKGNQLPVSFNGGRAVCLRFFRAGGREKRRVGGRNEGRDGQANWSVGEKDDGCLRAAVDQDGHPGRGGQRCKGRGCGCLIARRNKQDRQEFLPQDEGAASGPLEYHGGLVLLGPSQTALPGCPAAKLSEAAQPSFTITCPLPSPAHGSTLSNCLLVASAADRHRRTVYVALLPRTSTRGSVQTLKVLGRIMGHGMGGRGLRGNR